MSVIKRVRGPRPRQVCGRSTRILEIETPSSDGKSTYTVRVEQPDGAQVEHECSCPGFKFRRQCRHVQVVDESCGWVEGESKERQNGREKQLGICPRCGEATYVERFANADAS